MTGRRGDLNSTVKADNPVHTSVLGYPEVADIAALTSHISLLSIVSDLRSGFELGPHISADDALACLKDIVAVASKRERWLTAFKSPLGAAIVAAGRDLNTTLGIVLAALPAARS